MIWQNAWAWTGLLLLALPVLIHLLGRRSAHVQSFPSLRFLSASRLQAVRRTRLTDALLLAVRISILLAAVAALAQPLLLTGDRERRLASQLARVIVVDTSFSMRRTAASGDAAATDARREADRLAPEASASLVLESASPARALPGAAAWLSQQPGRREIVVVSDFQNGTLEAPAVAAIPPTIGLRFHRIDVASSDSSVNMVLAQHDGSETVAEVRVRGDATEIGWSVRSSGGTRTNAPELLAGGPEQEGARAALLAARELGLNVSADPARPVTIVFPDDEDRETVMREAGPLNRWMMEAVTRLGRDAMLAEAAASVETVRGVPDTAQWLIVTRSRQGQPLVLAAGRGDRLQLLSGVGPASVLSVALIRAAARASAPSPAAAELDPAAIPTALLAEWERPATPWQGPRGSDGSDGRWLWVLALAMLGLETLVRGKRRENGEGAPAEVNRERAA